MTSQLFSKPPSLRPVAVAPHAANDRKRILVVDDDEWTRVAMMRLFQSDFDVALAADGLEGIERATEPPGPNLVIADVTMPNLDGFEMVRRMRNVEWLRHTPVIFLTALTSAESIIAGIGAGARHYFAKPIDPDLLARKVQRVLGG